MEGDEQQPSNTIVRIFKPGASEDMLTLHFTAEFADGHQQVVYFPAGLLPCLTTLFLNLQAMAKRAGVVLISTGGRRG